MKPRIAVIHGEPAGIGPELIGKLLAEPDIKQKADIILVGDRHVFEMGMGQAKTEWTIRELDENDQPHWGDHDAYPLLSMSTIDEKNVRVAEISEAGGTASLRNLDRALDLTASDGADAVLFGPFNKASLHLAGMEEEDEHRYIARYLDFSGYHSEINMLDELITTRVTSHIALRNVADAIDVDGVVNAIKLANDTLISAGTTRPRIGVAALNPHAGDDGNFGTEEIDILAPAIEKARGLQIDVDGPWPSDTVFLRGRDGKLDAVVTMYHDQGQIAMKMMGFDRGVTIAAGLPVPVATPAHGTAFDIAGKGVANLNATRKAFDILCRMGVNFRRSRMAA
jgi:4-hydroxythreonine-4-phosphate dehydrogenase